MSVNLVLTIYNEYYSVTYNGRVHTTNTNSTQSYFPPLKTVNSDRVLGEVSADQYCGLTLSFIDGWVRR